MRIPLTTPAPPPYGAGMPLPGPGQLFDREFTAEGVRIGLLAEVEVAGSEIHLKDIVVYPRDAPRATIGAAAVLRALRSELMPELRDAGFTTVRITGERLSGAHPGRIVDITLELTLEDP